MENDIFLEAPERENAGTITSSTHDRLDIEESSEPQSVWDRKMFIEELKEILSLAGSMFISGFAYFLMFPISLLFVGTLGTVYLDAVGLGNTIFNVFAISVLNGLMTACDTTMSQSFGSKNKKMVGIYLQKGAMVYNLCILICISLLLNTETLLVLIGEDQEISRLAGEYVTILTMGIPMHAIRLLLMRWYRIQNVIWTSILTSIVLDIVSISLHYLFIVELGYDVTGSAYAQVIGFAMALMTSIIIVVCDRKRLRVSWGGFSQESLQDWGSFASIAFSGFLMMCLQWWGVEVCTLLAGTIGETELAAQAIVFQINYFLHMIPGSVGIGANILIGQHLGAYKPVRARLCLTICYGTAWTLSCVGIVILILLKDILPTIFSKDERVIALTSEIILYLAIYHIFDSTVASSQGICRGCARQKTAAFLSFIGIYTIGLPIALYMLLVVDFGVQGLWIGLSIGMAVEALMLFVVLMRTNWTKEAQDAQVRAGLSRDGKGRIISSQDPHNPREDEGNERTALIPDQPRKRLIQKKRYVSEHSSSQSNISLIQSDQKNWLTSSELVFRRGLALLVCTLIMATGIIVRLTFSVEYNWMNLCVMARNDTNNATSLPICP